MIDVHAHFAGMGYDFSDWEKVKRANVSVIFAADTLESAEWHAEFSEATGQYFTVGVHPEFAGTPLNERKFHMLAEKKNCVAVGEIGLDYHYPCDKAAQRALFVRQIELAAAHGLPMEIHSRDACADTLAVLKEHAALLGNGFLMHCYSYGAENLPAFLELGAYFSFGGVVCFKNARRAVEAAAACPEDKILSETDSPYLSPMRGEKNTPANIPAIVEKLAAIRGVSSAEMEAQIGKNAKTLFKRLQ